MSEMTQERSQKFFGYYDDPRQTVAVYDPGDSVPCLFCMKPWTAETVRTISLMEIFGIPTVEGDGQIISVPHGDRSYFYRVHRECDESLSQDEKALYEAAVMHPSTPSPSTDA